MRKASAAGYSIALLLIRFLFRRSIPMCASRLAPSILHDYGYFNGTVRSQTIVNPKDSLKAGITYTVDMRNPYFIDTVYYQRFTPQTLAIMDRWAAKLTHHPGRAVQCSRSGWWAQPHQHVAAQPRLLLLSSRLHDLSSRYDTGSRRSRQCLNCCRWRDYPLLPSVPIMSILSSR